MPALPVRYATLRSVTLLPCLMFLSILFPTLLTAQGIGIEGGFPFTVDPMDTASSPYLPNAYTGPAGSHGFVGSDAEGNFRFADGTPVRFAGVTIAGTACFPDSISAIATARRLRKLGVNLVRFQYMDFSYDWAATVSILDMATGFRSIQPEQARKFDWFVYQLKQNGIYSALTLMSARAPRVEDGISPAALDSIPWLAQGFNFLYPQARAAHKTVARALLDHVNSYTGTAYKDEPAIASMELLHRQSMLTFHHASQDFAGILFSGQMSRRVDTLYNNWLRNRYGSTTALLDAWDTPVPSGGYPNRVREGSFEGAFEAEWTITGNNGVSVTPILAGQDVPDGEYALQLRVRNTTGDLYSAVLWQTVNVEFNKFYRLTFKAKASNPEGRSLAVGIFAGDGGLFPGLYQTVEVSSNWEEDTLTILVPVANTVPQYLYIWCGEKDGELSIDDIRLQEVSPFGLLPDENLENVSVRRNGWGANQILAPQRFIDQMDFYSSLDRDYFGDLYRYVRDTVGAQQLISGSELNWASTPLDAAVQKEFDLTQSIQGWDWIGATGNSWGLNNYSPLRISWAGPTYNFAALANKGQPYIASFSSPFPNRYQAESTLQIPAYALLQDWDGFIWDHYDDDLADNRSDYIDSADWNGMRNNPVVSALMPSISQMLRNSLVAPARTTIRLQHTHDQLMLQARLENAWGLYSIPGTMNGFGAAISRIVLDSVNATEFTQANDFVFEGQVEGEVTSDTREIRWEYARGLLTLDANAVQGVSGVLNRPGGLSLKKMDVNAFTLNETATLLWVPLDPAQELDEPESRSLLTLVTRSEPTGWVWTDTTIASRWGAGPMLMEPARVQIDFKVGTDVGNVIVQPLDQTGMPTGERLAVTKAGNDFRVTINQNETKAVWYSVEMVPAGMSAGEEPIAGETFSVRAIPTVITDKGTIFLQLPTQQELQIELHDALGRLVRTLYSGTVEPGEQRIDFNAEGLPAGTYFVKAQIGGEKITTQTVQISR